VSHFTSVQTRLRDKAILLTALRDLGFAPREGDLEVRGYAGIRTRAPIVVQTKALGYDIGFRETPDGWDAVADWDGVRGMERQSFLDQLRQRYAYHASRRHLEAQGFQVVEEKNEQGRIHLVLRRMS